MLQNRLSDTITHVTLNTINSGVYIVAGEISYLLVADLEDFGYLQTCGCVIGYFAKCYLSDTH